MEVRHRFSPRNRVLTVTRGLTRVDHEGKERKVLDRAKQSFKDECDINVLMGRYLRGSSMDHLARYGAQYGEFSPLSFQEAMNTVAKATEMFEALPAELRKRFGNQPSLFLEFVQKRDKEGNLENLVEMRKLGLAPAAKPAEPTPRVRVENIDELRSPKPSPAQPTT